MIHCLQRDHRKEADDGRSRRPPSIPHTAAAFGVSTAVADASRVAHTRPVTGPEVKTTGAKTMSNRGLQTEGGSTIPLADLEADARYARERYELYRAKTYGPRLTSAARLRELDRRSKFAEARLDRAKVDHPR